VLDDVPAEEVAVKGHAGFRVGGHQLDPGERARCMRGEIGHESRRYPIHGPSVFVTFDFASFVVG